MKALVLKLSLLLLGIAVALAAVEIAVRFLPPPYPAAGPASPGVYEEADVLTCDPTLGWTGQPNFRGVVKTAVSEQKVIFNSQGLRDSDHPGQKPPGTFRLLLLGDSFIQALQVPQTAPVQQVLEERLNSGPATGRPTFEVLAAGAANWGTNQQLIYYREQGSRFEPDLVVLMFYFGNDLQDNLPGNGLTIQGFNCYAPYFVLCQDRLAAEPLPYAPGLSDLERNCSSLRRILIGGLGRLYQRSRLYQQLEPLLGAFHARRVFGDQYPNPYLALYLPHNDPDLDRAWQITQALILQLKTEVDQAGAQFAVALFDPELLVEFRRYSPDIQAAYLAQNPRLAGLQVDRPHLRLTRFLKEQEIPVIDLTGPLVAYQRTRQTPLYLAGDGHWSVAGHRVAADELARWLTENEFLPAGRF